MKSITLHHHWINRDCDLGVAESGYKTIELCDHHPETVLHELAHLWTQENHTKAWARALLLLHREFLSPQEQVFFRNEIGKSYKTAKEVIETEGIKGKCICGR